MLFSLKIKSLHSACRSNKTAECYRDRKSLLYCFYRVKMQMEKTVTDRLIKFQILYFAQCFNEEQFDCVGPLGDQPTLHQLSLTCLGRESNPRT